MPVELRKLTLSSEKFNSLSPADRYVFALVGHVFNELMILKKLICFFLQATWFGCNMRQISSRALPACYHPWPTLEARRNGNI